MSAFQVLELGFFNIYFKVDLGDELIDLRR